MCTSCVEGLIMVMKEEEMFYTVIPEEVEEVEAENIAEDSEELTRFELLCLRARNIFVAAAAVLFVVTLLPISSLGHYEHTLRGVAYFLGAGAYIAEIVELTDAERIKSKNHRRAMFMPYIFGVLYILLGISYFRG